ncbi:TetR/AcrR family transcriptional regulator [Sulfuriflexus sp.]|uniref:TetR/AcrR family transcriptional regulator n=1 Tax=Sulfuriflexus sp. TaxID=2015443 RepID=UPI0028CFD0D8|nr:TetR/AcrR family transcriptional regulator [Sulfuriflexus sp.]MDT8403450.1 TetR/AcrR family transcriptional regulator [Sulfuriflexus sp.]
MPVTQNHQRLIKAATKLFHTRGYAASSLKHLAATSDVPLGNIYYYFKTKDALADAVAEGHHEVFCSLFAELEARHADPGQRLLAFLEYPRAQRHVFTQRGCPVGALALELKKAGTDSYQSVRAIFRLQLDWFTAQFALVGRKDAATLAEHLVAALQGAILLSHTFNDHAILTRQLTSLRAWLQPLVTS